MRARTLLTMLAHQQGGLCNLSELGGALGVDYHTVAHLIDIFEGTYLVRRLRPYHANVGKRLVKAPKVYVRDTGILHALLDIPFTKAQLLRHPKAGASFETFCIEQLTNHAQLVDPDAEAYFYRTHGGDEVDLLLRIRGKLHPIEVMLGSTPSSPGRLERCMDQLGLKRGLIVGHTGAPLALSARVRFMGLRDAMEELKIVP